MLLVLTNYILLILCLIVCFTIRYYPRTIIPYAIAQDTFFHFFYADCIKNNNLKIPYTFDRIILPHKVSYPFLYHIILALLPRNYWNLFERITSPILDTLNTFAVFILARLVFQSYNTWEGLFMTQAVIWIYSLSPGLLRNGFGPRAYNGSPRILGQTLYLFHILFYLSSLKHNDIFVSNQISLIISIFFLSLIFISSKFSVQVILFFSIPFIIWDIQYLYICILAYFLSLFMTVGKVWVISIGHFKHSMFYFSNLQKRFIYNSEYYNKNTFSYFKGYLYRLENFAYRSWNVIKNRRYSIIEKKGLLDSYFKEFMFWIVSENFSLHCILFIFSSYIYVVIYISFLTPNFAEPVLNFMILWTLIVFFWFLIVQIRMFLFLGEAERYLEYALPASIILFVYYSVINFLHSIVVLYLLFILMTVYFNVKSYLIAYNSVGKYYFDIANMIAFMDNLPNSKIMTLHHNWQFLYRITKHKFLYTGANVDTRLLSIDAFNQVWGNYGLASDKLLPALDKYKIDYCVLEKKFLNYNDSDFNKDWKYCAQRFEKVYEDELFIVINVQKLD